MDTSTIGIVDLMATAIDFVANRNGMSAQPRLT